MIYTFDKYMNVVAPVNEDDITEVYEELEVTGIGNKFYLATEPNIISEDIRYIGIRVENEELYRIYEINQRKENEFEDEFAGVDFAIKDLQRDGVVIEFRNNDADFSSVVTNQILKGSSWERGNIDFSAKTNESFYYQSRWDCLQAVIEELGCEVQFVCAISNNKISRRYINFFKEIGRETQKRFEYGSNLLSVTKAEDNADLITRVYPRGKGEELQDEEGENTGNFTRRITIKDVEWKKSSGRPLDKPKGQEWLEDPELTALNPLHTGKPRTGVVIYDSCEEPSELIQLAYETLKLNGVPKAEFKVVAPTDIPLSLGDIVTVVNYERVYDLRTRIFRMKRFPLESFKNEYTFGDEVNRSAYKEVQNIIHENNNNIYEYVNGKVVGAANGINKVYFGKEFPTKAMKGDLFYKYVGINAKGEQDIEMWEFDGTTWNKIVDTAMADADRLVKGRIDAAKINVINLNAANITTGILRAIEIEGVNIKGSTITSESGSNRMVMSYGALNNYISSTLRSSLTPSTLSFKDTSARNVVQVDSSGIRINKKNTTTQLGYLGRGTDANTGKEEIAVNVEAGNIGSYAVMASSSATTYTRQFAVSSAGAHIGTLNMGGSYVGGAGRINNAYLYNTGVSSAFTVYNNVPIDFYSNLNMHGYSIVNQSDMRLKENIDPTKIDGIKETKKLKFYEFDRKQKFQFRDIRLQPSKKRELGLIAQESPFLLTYPEDVAGDDHYLSIDTSKQIMLNSLTNKQIIKVVESQGEKIEKLERIVAELCKKD